MKIIVLGASRGTGLYITKLAAEKGYEVTAVARKISTDAFNCVDLQQNRQNLKLISGDVLVPSSFETNIEGNDVVISSIGIDNRMPTELYSKGISNIINAMLNYNLRRLICVSALGVEVTPGMPAVLKLATKFILQPLFKNNFSDLLRMEDIVKKSKLNWTIVRPPRLLDGIPTGKYRFAVNNYLRNPFKIRRSDLAHFIVNNINNVQIACSKVEIAY